MKKVLVVFGTRPEAIKMCPLVLSLKRSKGIKCCVCLTGQHREMLDTVMRTFSVKADYDLDIMKENQTLTLITTDILNQMESVIESEKPDMLLVHGDTTTSFAAALAGFYHRIPVGHVEAGLRTYRMDSPYPEEFNRQAVDLMADIYFAPTKWAEKNLLSEGKEKEKIFVTGNTVIDALSTTVKQDYQNEVLDWAKDSRMILFTAHRRENIGEPMRNMFRALRRVLEEFPDVKVIYPVHKNPKVRAIVRELLADNDRIRIIEPLDVMDFHNFMAKSYLIMTDSGGIQEEAPALGIPVLVMRDTTERPEGIEAGTLKLMGTDEERIYELAKELLADRAGYEAMSRASNPYGDGHASEKIAQIIMEYLK